MLHATRDSSVQELVKFQNKQQEEITKKRSIISKLNHKMGIQLTVSNDFKLSQQSIDEDNFSVGLADQSLDNIT